MKREDRHRVSVAGFAETSSSSNAALTATARSLPAADDRRARIEVMAFGYRGNDTWRDMSEFVVHFTSGGDDSDGYNDVIDILGSGVIEARNEFGMARKMTKVEPTQECACFSEIPLEYLDRLTERRGSLYGLAFRKEFITAAGGGPVWYVEQASTLGRWVEATKDTALDPFVADHPIWHLTPFIERPGKYGRTEYRFEWEREWRVPGGLPFTPADVAFLFIPERLHEAALKFFSEAYEQNTGPAYLCPYIDPKWDLDQLHEEFAKVRRLN
jgi:hypothetical protein